MDQSISDFAQVVKVMNDCFHSYGVHSATVQPELITASQHRNNAEDQLRPAWSQSCQVKCGSSCEILTCCGWRKLWWTCPALLKETLSVFAQKMLKIFSTKTPSLKLLVVTADWLYISFVSFYKSSHEAADNIKLQKAVWLISYFTLTDWIFQLIEILGKLGKLSTSFSGAPH